MVAFSFTLLMVGDVFWWGKLFKILFLGIFQKVYIQTSNFKVSDLNVRYKCRGVLAMGLRQ